MLKNLFDGLTGKLRKTEDEAAVAEPDAPTSLPATQPDTGPVELPPTLGFVAHQPVLDRQQAVVAYEFTLRQGAGQTAARRREFDRMLLRTLRNMDLFRLLAYRRALVHLSLGALEEEGLLGLPERTVILVLDPVGDAPVTPEVLERIDTLKAGGVRFAVEPALYDARLLPEALHDAFFRRMDFMVLDFAAPSTRILAPFLDQLPKRYAHARWFARNVGSAEDLALCLQAPGNNRFALFHGSYLATARTMDNRKQDNGSQTRVLQIMRLLRANADARTLEAQFKLDSVLLFKLLRFINSPVNGLAKQVQSVEDALLLLGRESLFKWLSMLLFTARKDDGHALALLEKSLIRARFMERLGQPQDHRLVEEHLFLTGMFSLLDVLLGVPFPDVIGPLDLPVTVRDALNEQKGPFAPQLALAMACEQGESVRIQTLARLLNRPVEAVGQLYMDAVVWAQEVLRASEVHNNVEAV